MKTAAQARKPRQEMYYTSEEEMLRQKREDAKEVLSKIDPEKLKEILLRKR